MNTIRRGGLGPRPELGGSTGPGVSSPLGRSAASAASAATSGFDGLSGRRSDARGRYGSGTGGTTSSAAGYGLMQRLADGWKHKRGAMVAGALGFALLIPPLTGQLMHPGLSPDGPVRSPVAVQLMQQQEEVASPAMIGRAVQEARSAIPDGTGPSRDAAVTGLIQVAIDAQQQGRQARSLSSEAAKTMQALEAEVGLDARLGFVADVYWFGVPDAHHVYHQGDRDAGAIASGAQAIGSAADRAVATARGEVRDLLYETSPSFKTTADRFDVVHARFEIAQHLQQLAKTASDELASAENFIMLRNVTPKTVTVEDYETRTTTNADGSTTTEEVHVGSHEEPNPAWATYNAAAILAKANAESAIRALNSAVGTAKSVFPESELAKVDTDLIGFLDFFGHPSFLLWSFDSMDVDAAQAKVGDLRDAATELVGSIRPEHTQLKNKIESTITMKWDALLAGRPADAS
jgi:hypothetical protein